MQHNSADLHKPDDLDGIDAADDAELASYMGDSDNSCPENVG